MMVIIASRVESLKMATCTTATLPSTTTTVKRTNWTVRGGDEAVLGVTLGPHMGLLPESQRMERVERGSRQHTQIHTHTFIFFLKCRSSSVDNFTLLWRTTVMENHSDLLST